MPLCCLSFLRVLLVPSPSKAESLSQEKPISPGGGGAGL